MWRHRVKVKKTGDCSQSALAKKMRSLIKKNNNKPKLIMQKEMQSCLWETRKITNIQEGLLAMFLQKNSCR
jgi:hypothetical protein